MIEKYVNKLHTKIVKEDNKKELFSEKLKFGVLAFLSFSILVGSFLLFWQMQKQNQPQVTYQNDQLRSEVETLNNKVEELSKTLTQARQVEETTVTEVDTKVTTEERVAGVSDSRNGSEVASLININTAGSSQLESLPGIGPTYAQRIIEYRTSSGGFQSTSEIQNVKGIGPKTFEKIKGMITI